MKKFIASFLSLFFVLNSVSVMAFALDNPKLDVLYECNSWNQAVSTGNVVFNNCKVDNKQIKLPSVDLSDNLNNYSKNSVGFQFKNAAIKKITIKFHSRSSCSVLNEGNKLVLESMGNPFLNEDLIAVRDKNNRQNLYAKSKTNENLKYIIKEELTGKFFPKTKHVLKTLSSNESFPSQYDYYGLNVIGTNNLAFLAKLKSSNANVKTDSNSTNFYEYTNTYEFNPPVSQATMYFDLSPVDLCPVGKNSTAVIESIKIEGIKNKEMPKEDENKDNGKVDKEETEKPIDKPTDKPASPEESKKPSIDDKKPKPVEPDKPSKNDPTVKPQKPNNKQDEHFPSVSFGDSIINRNNMEVKSNNNDSNSSTNVSKVVTSILDIKTKEISSDKTKDQNIQKKVIAKNAETISLKAIEEAKEKNIKIYADTATGYKVKARVYIPADKEISSDINVLFNEKATKKSKYVFESFFDNDVECIKFGEDGNEDLKLRTATKLDLSNLNTDELYFYAYSLETNSYYKFSDSTSFIDKNGYIHLTMPMDRVAIITDKPLKLK